MRLILILLIAATLNIPTFCKYGDWIIYKSFFMNPAGTLVKNYLLGRAYQEYFNARNEAEEKKAIVKISYITQLHAIKTIMDSYKDTIRYEKIQLVEDEEGGKIVNGYEFLKRVKAEIVRSDWNAFGLCQLLIFSDTLRYLTLPFRVNTTVMKFHKIQCSPDWDLNLEDPMHVEIWIEANFVEFLHNFPFDIHLSKYINDIELSLLTKQKLIKLFGKARFMVLHQEKDEILNRFANEDKQSLLIEFYKTFFTPKDRSLTDWRTKFAADYLVYVEWQKRQEKADMLSTLDALKKLWQDALKVYLDDLDEQWRAFITSPKWKDNWTPEMSKRATQNAYMNQEKMYCDVEVKRKSPLQVAKECIEQEIHYIFGQQKKGKLKGADKAEILKSWRACMNKKLFKESQKKINENLRAVEKMHLEKIKEICRDETNGFREFVRNEAHTSLVQKITGVTLSALLRLTKPDEPSIKQDDENAQQKMDENMDEVVENESDDEIVEEKLTDIEEKIKSPPNYKNPIGKSKFAQKSTSPTYSSVIARERNKARVARKWLTMATYPAEIMQKSQKTLKSSKPVIKNQLKEITMEEEVKEERIFGQNLPDDDAFDLELETQPIDDLKQLYAIYLGKDKINKNFEYLLHISVLREAISQKIKTAEILNESKMRNDDRNNLIKLEKIFDDFKKSWKSRINNKSGKEKNKIVFMKIMLAKHFEFYEGIKNLSYQSLSDEKIVEMELLMEKGLGKIKSINFEFLSKLHLNTFALMAASNSSKEHDFMQEMEIFSDRKNLRKLQFIMQYNDNDQVGKKSKLEQFAQKLQEMIESDKEMLKQEKLDTLRYKDAAKPNINAALYKFTQNEYLSFDESNLNKFYNKLEHEYEISEDIIDANESALDWLEERVAKWIRIVSRAKEREDLYKNDPTLQNFHLIIYGSHLLETNTVTSDIDVLCVVPNYVNQYNFTDSDSKDSLYSILKSGLQKTDFINVVAKSRVLLIQLKVNGVEIDINFAKTPWILVNGRDLMQDEVIEENTHVKSVYALAGYRGLLRQRQMCPPSATFKNFLRTLKLWAKRRLIYSNILGYLSGTSLTTMATKLCLIYPNGNLVFLLKQFFYFFKFWGWPRPALLEEPIKKSEFAKARALNVVPWSEEKMKRDDDKMPIIMPTFPEQNTAHNVNEFSKQIIMREIERAYGHLAQIDTTTSGDLEHLLENFLEKLNYETHYSHFLIVSCVPKITNLENAKNEVAIICSEKKPRLRVVLEKWAKNWKELILEYHVIPTIEKSGQCRIDDNTTSECIVWLVAANFENKAMDSKYFSETLDLSDYLPYSLHSQYVSGNELKQSMDDFIQEDSSTSGVKNLEEKMLN